MTFLCLGAHQKVQQFLACGGHLQAQSSRDFGALRSGLIPWDEARQLQTSPCCKLFSVEVGTGSWIANVAQGYHSGPTLLLSLFGFSSVLLWVPPFVLFSLTSCFCMLGWEFWGSSGWVWATQELCLHATATFGPNPAPNARVEPSHPLCTSISEQTRPPATASNLRHFAGGSLAGGSLAGGSLAGGSGLPDRHNEGSTCPQSHLGLASRGLLSCLAVYSALEWERESVGSCMHTLQQHARDNSE